MNGRHVLVLLIALLGYAGVLQARAQQQDPFERGQCEQQFKSLEAELIKRGTALKSAGEKKAPPTEICKLLRSYVTTEAQMLKFLTEKKAACGVPDQIIGQAKGGHAKSTAMRDQVCKVAATGGTAGAPPPPSQGLSGALGTSVLGGPPTDPQGGSGVFDTLTGNVLRR